MSKEKEIVRGFSTLSSGSEEPSSASGLHWYCAPDSWDDGTLDPNRREGRGGSWSVLKDGESLAICPPAKKDFWRKTYYNPVVVRDDGPCVFATLSNEKTFTIETTFELEARRQFDQAGICIRIDSDHWIKTGIEFVDGFPRLSCVVTNTYSDWSTQPWPSSRAAIRVHVISPANFVVEAAPLSESSQEREGDWSFIRIAHLSAGTLCQNDPLQNHPNVLGAWQGKPAPPGNIWAGPFACCPEDQLGCTATFHSFSIKEGSDFQHNADANAE